MFLHKFGQRFVAKIYVVVQNKVLRPKEAVSAKRSVSAKILAFPEGLIADSVFRQKTVLFDHYDKDKGVKSWSTSSSSAPAGQRQEDGDLSRYLLPVVLAAVAACAYGTTRHTFHEEETFNKHTQFVNEAVREGGMITYLCSTNELLCINVIEINKQIRK